MTPRATVREVKELAERLKRYSVSAATAANYIGVSQRAVYGWLARPGPYRHEPSPGMRRLIKMGIERMDAELGAPTRLRIYYYRRALWHRLSHDQQSALFALLGVEGFEEKYLAALEKHAARLGVKVKIPADTQAPAPPAPVQAGRPRPFSSLSLGEIRSFGARWRKANKAERSDILDALKKLGVERAAYMRRGGK